MPWISRGLVFLVLMSGLSTGFIDACTRGLGAKRLRLSMPWDQTQFEPLISDDSPRIFKPPVWVEFPVQTLSQTDAVSRPVKLDRFNAKVHLSDISWVGAEDQKLNAALQMWRVIVLDSTSNTELGKLIMQCIELGRSDDYIWQVIRDAFASKSTATLRARSASLLAFGRWKKTALMESANSIFPVSEEAAYEYLCDLRRTNAAAMKGKRFLEALGFSKGLLGADVDKAINSARVKGAASNFEFKPVKKKSPFSVEQLLVLERLAMFGQGQESIFAGYLCFITHCRLRWSDGQHCIQEPQLDIGTGKGFIEAALYHHKTALKRRTKVSGLLPVAGVLPGLSGYDWASSWLQKRMEMGLRASMSQPTMPAPMAHGGWSCHPLSSSEASVWLREILQPWTQGPVRNLATQSAKATLLSWLAKANVEISLRRLAGYHVTPGDKSALEYSRDAAAPVLRQIEAAFIAIRANVFRPDLTRARRWQGAQTLEEAVKLAADGDSFHACSESFGKSFSSSLFSLECSDVPLENNPDHGGGLQDALNKVGDDTTLETLRLHALSVNRNAVVCNDDDSISDISEFSQSQESSVDSESGSEDAERRAELDGVRNSVDLVAPSDIAGKRCFRHRKSKKLHFIDKTMHGVQYFKCGRRCNENYEKLESVPAFSLHGCMTCFGWSDRPAEASDQDD